MQQWWVRHRVGRAAPVAPVTMALSPADEKEHSHAHDHVRAGTRGDAPLVLSNDATGDIHPQSVTVTGGVYGSGDVQAYGVSLPIAINVRTIVTKADANSVCPSGVTIYAPLSYSSQTGAQIDLCGRLQRQDDLHRRLRRLCHRGQRVGPLAPRRPRVLCAGPLPVALGTRQQHLQPRFRLDQ
jgi:hypothetical protein